MTTDARKIHEIQITEPVRGTRDNGTHMYLEPGTYRIEMPADYDPALVTPEDVVHDGQIRVVEDL
jgi:hypothetical protein